MSLARGSSSAPSAAGAIDRLTPFERWAWSRFGRWSGGAVGPRLSDDLVRAQWRITPEEFIASRWAVTALSAAVFIAASLGLVVGFGGAVAARPVLALAVLAVPLGGTASAYLAYSALPSARAAARGQEIDRSLGPALAFVAALSLADVPVEVIFRDLSEQEPYGEVAAEAAWIVRDSETLGVDILSAIRAQARRSPSTRFQEFLQGVVTTAESGGELRPYFLAQADRFERESSAVHQGRLERLGVLAEAYVALAVAFPLFLLVLLTVFTLVEGNSTGLLAAVWFTVLLLIPVAELGFAWVFRSYREGT